MGKVIFEFNATTGDVSVRKAANDDYVRVVKGGVEVALIPVAEVSE